MARPRNKQHVIDRIIAIGRQRRLPQDAILANLATGSVETRFQNLKGGDRDSAGYRQERGQFYKNPTNLDAAINRFYDEWLADAKGKGLSVGQQAQAVQQSGFPGRYATRVPLAKRLLAEQGGFKGGEGMAGVAKNRVRTSSTTSTDTDGALVDALMAGAAGRRKGGLLADASRRIDSGAYTSTTRTKETIPVGTGGTVRDAAVSARGLHVQKDANHGAMSLVKYATRGFGTSGERTPAQNAAAGGAAGSDHLTTNTWASAEDAKYGTGRTIARRLGIKGWKKGTYDRHIIKVDGRTYSVQILEDVEGHYDHTHVGIQRVR